MNVFRRVHAGKHGHGVIKEQTLHVTVAVEHYH